MAYYCEFLVLGQPKFLHGAFVIRLFLTGNAWGNRTTTFSYFWSEMVLSDRMSSPKQVWVRFCRKFNKMEEMDDCGSSEWIHVESSSFWYKSVAVVEYNPQHDHSLRKYMLDCFHWIDSVRDTVSTNCIIFSLWLYIALYLIHWIY